MTVIPDDIRARAETFASAGGIALQEAVRKAVPANQGPEASLVWRLKSPESIERKLAHQAPADTINDFVGFRLIVAHMGQLESAIAAARGWAKAAGLLEKRYENYLLKARADLYRSVHIDLTFPSSIVVEQQALGVEIQITTYLQNFHSTISHRLAYPKGESAVATSKLTDVLRAISEKLWEVDTATASIFDPHGTE